MLVQEEDGTGPPPPPPPPAAGEGRLEPASTSHMLHTQTKLRAKPTHSLLLAPEGMDCFGNERQVLAEQVKFYNSPVLSDIMLKVGEHLYPAHKLVLVRASEVFERMLSTQWTNDEDNEIELFEDHDCVPIFHKFLRYLYCCHVVLNCDDTLPVLVLADKYNVSDLRQVCVEFAVRQIVPKLQLKDVFHIWFQYSTKCYHHKLTHACVRAMAEKMEDIMSSEEWDDEWMHLDVEQMCEFLHSSDLVIKDEYELWLAVARWLQAPLRAKEIGKSLRAILPFIRFPMMTPDQLCELEKYMIVEQHHSHFMPYLVTAYKYNSLPLTSRANSKEFTGSQFLLREYTELRWDKRLVIPNWSSMQRCSEVIMRLCTRSSSFPSATWDWELKVWPKGSPTNEEFRCLLNTSNFYIDQPRPVEFLLSIVDERNILRTVVGRKNFSKTRYSADTEIDKKVSVFELMQPGSQLLVDDSLTLQLTFKPVE